jgi:Myb/SANT-like DNA-binding domain
MARPKKTQAIQPSHLSQSITDDSITVSSSPPPPAHISCEYTDPEDDPFSLPQPGSESVGILPTKTPQKEALGSGKIAWTYTMEEALFTTLLEKVRSGKRADSGFKYEAWIDALEAVRSRAPSSIHPLLSIEKLKSKESNTKASYRDWKWLIGQSGFGLHPETRVVTASNEAWDEVLKVCFLMPFMGYLLIK